MNIMETVNWMQQDEYPGGTIRKWALKQEDLPDGIPFMKGFVELFFGAKLPAESAVIAYQPTYDAIVATQQANAQAKASRPDLETIVAQMAAAIVNNGIELPVEVVEAINIKLSAIDEPIISAQLARDIKL